MQGRNIGKSPTPVNSPKAGGCLSHPDRHAYGLHRTVVMKPQGLSAPAYLYRLVHDQHVA
jgi:hypothetical protein